MSANKQKVFITRYALTKGIIEGEYIVYKTKLYENRECVSHQISNNSWYTIHCLIGEDAHYTRKNAVKKAEAMRDRKIMALEKQITKLRKLKFENE